MIARLRLDFHSAAFEVILAIKERPRNVLLPALDPDIAAARNQEYRKRPERPDIFCIFHSPAFGGRQVRAIFRGVEGQPNVQMTEDAEQNQLVIQHSGRLVLEQLTCMIKMLDIP